MVLERVIAGAPWTFNGQLMVFHQLDRGEDPLKVPLTQDNFWVQIHEVSIGFFSGSFVRQMKNFIGKFMEYDSKSLSRGMRVLMHI